MKEPVRLSLLVRSKSAAVRSSNRLPVAERGVDDAPERTALGAGLHAAQDGDLVSDVDRMAPDIGAGRGGDFRHRLLHALGVDVGYADPRA